MKVRAAIVAMAVAVAGCDDDVDLQIKLVVPPEIPSIQSGMLELSLWVYDPLLADAPAALGDRDERDFVHLAGATDTFLMFLEAHVPGNHRYYVTARGYDRTGLCVREVLWDGHLETSAPRTIIMRLLPQPRCVGPTG